MHSIRRFLVLIVLFVIVYGGLSFMSASINASLPTELSADPPSLLVSLENDTSSVHQAETSPGSATSAQPGYIQDELPNPPLATHNWMFIAGEFWLLGLLLAFTPCILPLLIIVSGFLGDETGSTPKRRTVMLSVTYVLALASTYAVAGVVAGFFGIYLQAYLQKPWIIITFSVIIVLLAMSLLGIYKITLPPSIRHLILRHNKMQASYKYFEVALMGIFATLIASPCLAAPLITLLGYIGATGSIIIGFLALFFVGIGIGTPLLVATTIGKDVLPHDDKWQPVLKQIFGLGLLGIAIWVSSRAIRPDWSMILWSVLIVYTANYMYSLHATHFQRIPNLWKSICIMILAYGVAIFFGSMLGNHNPANPLSLTKLLAPKTVSMQNANTLEELNKLIITSAAEGKPVLIYFTADWCVNCQSFKESVLKDQSVMAELAKFSLIEINLTDTNSPAYSIAAKYGVIGTPEVIFYDANGKLFPARIAGKVSAQTFIDTIISVNAAK